MPAEGGRLAAQAIKVRFTRACFLQAILATDVHHAVLSVLLAEHRHLAALDIKPWLFRAGIMRAMLVDDVHHTFLSMFLTEYC